MCLGYAVLALAAGITYAYDAFGNTVARTGTTVNPYQYRGEQFDASLAMYYLRARYYIPQTGRFLTQDTYEGDDEDPLSLHEYLYANADPANGIDPSGFANMVENSLATQFGNITRQVFSVFNTGMRGLTLGRVRAGAKLAYDTICCLDKAWSVLDLALTVISGFEGEQQAQDYLNSPAHLALMTIDVVCRLKCGAGIPMLFFVGGPRGPRVPPPGQGAPPPPEIPIPPGSHWEWNPNPGNSRGGTWRPNPRGPNAPEVSWDGDIPPGHWDWKPGDGGTVRRWDKWGNELPPGKHRKC